MIAVPDDPVFVNRRTQLALFAEALAGLGRGERRHLALLGLRRIGKTTLIDEVRARHPEACTAKIAVDATAATPEGFALEMVAAVLRAAVRARGSNRPVTTQPRSITAAAGVLGEAILPPVEEILDLLETRNAYGRLLLKQFAFPAEVSDALDLPLLVFLDEFQDIRRLQNFPGTSNLWAAIREALDRRGKAAFAIAGSIVTMMRKILRDGSDPLFTRFEEVYLPPFSPEDTFELAVGVWERGGLAWDHNAAQRAHVLSQGFPFYAHVLARAAADMARAGEARVLGDHVDAAFQHLLLNRDSPLAIYMQYLLQQAIGEVSGKNIPEAVLRYLAQNEGVLATDIARALRRGNGGQVHDVVTELVDIDILWKQDDGRVWFVDPLLPLWIALDRERQETGAAFADPKARARVAGMAEERLRGLQEAMGRLFETRVHNVLRQFRGQTVSARLFGQQEGTVVLPTIRDVRQVEFPDPSGDLGGSPGTVEIDGLATGTETWVVEAKHRKGGVAGAQVDRFLRKCRFIEEHGHATIGHRWIVSETGFRTDARERCERESVFFTNARQLSQLERALRE